MGKAVHCNIEKGKRRVKETETMQRAGRRVLEKTIARTNES